MFVRKDKAAIITTPIRKVLCGKLMDYDMPSKTIWVKRVRPIENHIVLNREYEDMILVDVKEIIYLDSNLCEELGLNPEEWLDNTNTNNGFTQTSTAI